MTLESMENHGGFPKELRHFHAKDIIKAPGLWIAAIRREQTRFHGEGVLPESAIRDGVHLPVALASDVYCAVLGQIRAYTALGHAQEMFKAMNVFWEELKSRQRRQMGKGFDENGFRTWIYYHPLDSNPAQIINEIDFMILRHVVHMMLPEVCRNDHRFKQALEQYRTAEFKAGRDAWNAETSEFLALLPGDVFRIYADTRPDAKPRPGLLTRLWQGAFGGKAVGYDLNPNNGPQP